MGIQQLNTLDFSSGIKAAPIDSNFDLINDWIKRERLRIGGWGIVEGFDLSFDQTTLSVTVGKGTIINKDGEEVTVDQKTFIANGLKHSTVEKTCTVDNDGRIILDDNVYDFYNRQYLVYNPPDTDTEIDDSIIKVRDIDDYPVTVNRILGNIIWVSTSYAGSPVTVAYSVAHNRIDTIMLHLDGTYDDLQSIESPNPSHVDLADYETSLCVAVLYWQITETGIICDFFSNHKSYRTVYVDNNNDLYINGEKYQKQKFIYFIEPPLRDRQEHDLWYNTKDNTLYIWRQTDGEWGWTIVNDHSEIVIQERKLWLPTDNPEDLQTFLFDVEELNLRYIPNSNALTIFIDNAALMPDQYEEVSTTQTDIDALVAQAEELDGKITSAKRLLDTFKKNRDGLLPSVKALRKDLADSAKLYPELYSLTNDDYTIKDSDLSNIRNLMSIDTKFAKIIHDLLDLLSQIESQEILIRAYEQELQTVTDIINVTHVSKGIGFKLKNPLLHPAFVAVTVTHAVRMKPARETFQRGAVFVKEANIDTTAAGQNQVFETTAASYTVGQEQLEVYVDGIKLPRNNEGFCEIADTVTPFVNYSYTDEDIVSLYRDTISSHFKILKEISVGQTVTYRISRQVWNYDQLDALVSGIKSYANSAMSKANTALEQVTALNNNFPNALEGINASLSSIQRNLDTLQNTCYKHSDTMEISNMPSEIKEGTITDVLDIMVPITGSTLTVNNVKSTDIFSVYYVSNNDVRMLIQDGIDRDVSTSDYSIVGLSGSNVRITLKDDLVTPNSNLYIKGLKRGVDNE